MGNLPRTTWGINNKKVGFVDLALNLNKNTTSLTEMWLFDEEKCQNMWIICSIMCLDVIM